MSLSPANRKSLNRAKLNYYYRTRDDEEYKEKRKFVRFRSYAKSYVNKIASKDDLEELSGWINQRMDELKNNQD